MVILKHPHKVFCPNSGIGHISEILGNPICTSLISSAAGPTVNQQPMIQTLFFYPVWMVLIKHPQVEKIPKNWDLWLGIVTPKLWIVC